MLQKSWHLGAYSSISIYKPRYFYSVTLAIISAATVIAAPLLWLQQNKAKLEADAQRVKHQLASDQPIAGLVDAVAAIGQNQAHLPQILPQIQSNLLEAVQTARERNRLELGEKVNTANFSPDGNRLAIGTGNTVRLWQRQGSEQILQGEAAIRAVQLSPDGTAAMANPADTGTVQFWDLQHSTYQPPTNFFTAAAFSSDGEMILNGSNAGRVRLWSRQGELIGRLEPFHQGDVTAVAFDSGSMMSAGADGRIHLWNNKGEWLGHLWAGANIHAMRVSQSGQRILIEDRNRAQVFLWNSQVHQWSQFLLGETPTVRTADLSGDNTLIARGLADGTVQLLPLDSQNRQVQTQLWRGHQGAVNTVLFSPSSKTIVSGGEDGTVRFWDVTDGTSISRFHLQQGQQNPMTAALSANGKYLAVVRADGKVSIHDSHQTLLSQFSNPFQSAIAKLVFSADGQALALQTESGQVVVVNHQGHKLMPVLNLKPPIQGLALGSKGEQLLSASATGLQLWKRQGAIGQPQPQLTSPQFLSLSADGQHMISGSHFIDTATQKPIGQTCLWTLTSRLQLQHCEAIPSRTASFSPDGQMVAIGSEDGQLRLWNRTGKTLYRLPSHTASISAVAFDAAGETIVSGSIDGTLRLASRQGVLLGQPLIGDQTEIEAVAFRADQDKTQIVSLSRDREVRLWQGNWRGWLNTACDRLQAHPVFQHPQTDSQRQAKATCDRLATVATVEPTAPVTAAPADSVELIVKLSQRRVYVHQGNQVTSYPIAVGQPGWETPTGRFKISQMLRHPGWTHPLTGAMLPTGVDNPLGERWMAFWNDGHNQIGFHGTPDRASVGTAASHGCLRMYNEDAEALYEQIKLGTIVTVQP